MYMLHCRAQLQRVHPFLEGGRSNIHWKAIRESKYLLNFIHNKLSPVLTTVVKMGVFHLEKSRQAAFILKTLNEIMKDWGRYGERQVISQS
jgi:hypothetical protein